MQDKHDFWLDLWEQNQTGWHQQEFNQHLESHLLPRLGAGQQTIFVPLCGKSKDMLWMIGQGYRVIGVELSEVAVEAFFRENSIDVERIDTGGRVTFESPEIKIIVGDFFSLTPQLLEEVTYVYDRAALIALDPEMRVDYASKLRQIIPPGAQLLLLSIEYSGTMTGPPFSVPEQEVMQLFGENLAVSKLEEIALPDEDNRFKDRGGHGLVEKIYWISHADSELNR
jgi:thiopurine S-methyltransferase